MIAKREAESPGIARRRWILLLALLLTPVGVHAGEALFLVYLAVAAAALPWREVVAPRLLLLASGVAIAAIWLATGTTGDSGWHHPLAAPHRHSVSLLDYLIVLFGFALLAMDRYSVGDVKAILTALVATVPLHFALAVGQRYGGWRTHWSAMRIGEAWLLELNLRIPPVLAGRTSAGLAHPNALGAYSLIGAVAAAVLLADELRTRPASESDRPRTLRRAGLAASFLFCLAMLAWSGSRGAWLAAVALSLPVAWLVGIRLRYLLASLATAGLGVAVAAMELGALTRVARRIVPVVVWGRLSASPPPGLRVSAPDWRLRVYRCALDLTAETPLLGRGIGGWVEECEARLGSSINHAHNLFLQVAVESGWPAAIALALSLAWVLGASAQRVGHLPTQAARRLYGAWILIAIAVLLANQTSMVLMHTSRLEIVFALALALPYSLVFHRPLRA